MATKWERIAARTGHPFDNVPGLPCRLIDPDVFFPKPGHKADRAVAACQTCPITVECLSFALETGQRFGVWGGERSEDRDRISLAKREEIAAQARKSFLARLTATLERASE